MGLKNGFDGMNDLDKNAKKFSINVTLEDHCRLLNLETSDLIDVHAQFLVE